MLLKQYLGRTLTILLLLIPSATSIEAASQSERRCALVVTAKVVNIGENPRQISGSMAVVYWLASYEIVEVIKGHPSKAEISVAHLVLKGNELENIRAGDRVLLCLNENKPNKQFKHVVLLSADYIGELILVECKCK
jgi:hypothetical protein